MRIFLTVTTAAKMYGRPYVSAGPLLPSTGDKVVVSSRDRTTTREFTLGGKTFDERGLVAFDLGTDEGLVPDTFGFTPFAIGDVPK